MSTGTALEPNNWLIIDTKGVMTPQYRETLHLQICIPFAWTTITEKCIYASPCYALVFLYQYFPLRHRSQNSNLTICFSIWVSPGQFLMSIQHFLRKSTPLFTHMKLFMRFGHLWDMLFSHLNGVGERKNKILGNINILITVDESPQTWNIGLTQIFEIFYFFHKFIMV